MGMFDDLIPDIEKDITEEIKRKISALYCPVHKQHPTVKELSLKNHQWRASIATCCQELQDKIDQIMDEE